MKLYHGTSAYRYQQMLKDGGVVKMSQIGDKKLSLTSALSVAVYWATSSTKVDFDEGRSLGCTNGIVLIFDQDELLKHGYFLQPFDDQIWGPGECTHEQEIACWSDIDINNKPYLTDVWMFDTITDKPRRHKVTG